MLAQLGARMRSLLRGDQYWEQGPVTDVGAIRLMRRVRERWEILHNTAPGPRRFDIRAVLLADEAARTARAAPPPLADGDWNVPLPSEWIDAQGNVTRLDDAFFAQREYRLESLTGFPDAVFVSMAYRCVLKRAPDRTGFHSYLTRLRGGTFDRIDVLRSLVRSSEAEPIGVRITKLRVLDFSRRAQHVRVVGPFIAWGNAFVRLPRLVRRQQLLEAQLAAARRENRDETREIINATVGPIVSSLRALELARAQIEDGLTAVAQVLERLDADGRRRVEEADAQGVRMEDRLSRLDAAANLERERLEWLERRLQPSVGPAAGEPASLDEATIALVCAEVEVRLRGESTAVVARSERRSAWIRDAGFGTSDTPVLDLGCGRGDWLAVLRDGGFEARGIDESSALIEACRGRGLVAERADPSRWLMTVPSEHFGAVSALHLVEGMPLLAFVELLRRIHVALVADGLVIIEVAGLANPVLTNALRDLRPVRPFGSVPLTPAVLEYLATSQGFERVSIVHDVADASGAQGDAGHYTLLARKPQRSSMSNALSS